MHVSPTLLKSVAIAVGLSTTQATWAADEFLEALTDGEVSFASRLRYESVSDEQNPADDASALTLRLLLGYQTANYRGFHAYLEFEGTEHLEIDDFNSVVNSKTEYDVVPDPEGAELNQYYLAYQGPDEQLKGKLGRQIIAWNNQRHIGHVGWRQNWQTFDAASVDYTFNDQLSLDAALIYNRNTIFGTKQPMTTFIGMVDYAILDNLSWTGYAHYMDWSDESFDALDHSTVGGFFDGSYELSEKSKLLYRAELAFQQEAADNDIDYSALYTHLVGGFAYAPFTVNLGWEELGSDEGKREFIVPLGTNHKFNGWTDRLLGGAGDNGLRDLYLSAGAKVPAAPGLSGKVVFHQFSESAGGDAIGSEIDAVVTYQCQSVPKLVSGAKVGIFSADDDSNYDDTTKFWLWSQYAF